jgi:hypothetical protein
VSCANRHILLVGNAIFHARVCRRGSLASSPVTMQISGHDADALNHGRLLGASHFPIPSIALRSRRRPTIRHPALSVMTGLIFCSSFALSLCLLLQPYPSPPNQPITAASSALRTSNLHKGAYLALRSASQLPVHSVPQVRRTDGRQTCKRMGRVYVGAG